MEIKVIGSGSSGNCYLIHDGYTKLLLDCGLPMKNIRIGCDFKLTDVAGCFITHCHRDHCKSMLPLMVNGINCYCAEEELSLLGDLERMNIQMNHRFHALEQGYNEAIYREIKIGTFRVIPFSVAHDTPKPVGYLLFSNRTKEKLLYFTDTYTVPYRFIGLTHIIGECNYDSEELWEHIEEGSTHTGRAKRLFRSHMSLDNFLLFLDQQDKRKLKQIYICHMSDDHGDEEKIKKSVQEATGVEVLIC